MPARTRLTLSTSPRAHRGAQPPGALKKAFDISGHATMSCWPVKARKGTLCCARKGGNGWEGWEKGVCQMSQARRSWQSRQQDGPFRQIKCDVGKRRVRTGQKGYLWGGVLVSEGVLHDCSLNGNAGGCRVGIARREERCLPSHAATRYSQHNAEGRRKGAGERKGLGLEESGGRERAVRVSLSECTPVCYVHATDAETCGRRRRRRKTS